MRDFHDTVTLHPPAGFSLRLMSPAQNPGAASGTVSTPDPDSAAAEAGSVSPALPVAGTRSQAASHGSGFGGQSSDSSSSPDGQGAQDDRSFHEDTEAAIGLTDEVREAWSGAFRRVVAPDAQLTTSACTLPELC